MWAAVVGLAATGLVVSACGSQSTPTGAGSAPSGAVVGTAVTPTGTILVDAHGKAIYAFAADSPGKSNCTGSCLSVWPAVTVPATLPAPPTGVTAKLGEITRTDGTGQLTVNGWPAYTYVGDSGPGTATGQGKNLNGGLWWVFSPTGAQIKSTT